MILMKLAQPLCSRNANSPFGQNSVRISSRAVGRFVLEGETRTGGSGPYTPSRVIKDPMLETDMISYLEATNTSFDAAASAVMFTCILATNITNEAIGRSPKATAKFLGFNPSAADNVVDPVASRTATAPACFPKTWTGGVGSIRVLEGGN
jgi:hypothetical protein